MKGYQRVLCTLVLASVACVFALGGCGSNTSGSAGTGEASASKELVVFNWAEYIDPEVITEFEEETGITVVYEEFSTNEIMYPLLAQDPSAYDILCPSDYMISKLIEQDMLLELDMEKLPTAREQIGEQYWKESEGFDPGNKYSVPYCWGTVGILYNTTMVDDVVDSWSILWDEKYAGQIYMQDSVRDLLMVPLMMKGYSINTLNENELEEATQMLIDQKPLVQGYFIDQVRDKMIGGEGALGVIYSGEAIYTQRENPDLEYVIPKEGTNVWIDSWVISKEAKNVENAYAWIEFMSRPEIALRNFEYITYSTPNDGARELIEDEDIKNSEIAFPDLSKYKLETFLYLGEEGDKLYNDYWMRIKSE